VRRTAAQRRLEHGELIVIGQQRRTVALVVLWNLHRWKTTEWEVGTSERGTG
jgi:hypothetical protein